MKISNIEYSSRSERVNDPKCNSGYCGPQNIVVTESIGVTVEIGNGMSVRLALTREEIDYINQIVFARAKEAYFRNPLSTVFTEVEAKNRGI